MKTADQLLIDIDKLKKKLAELGSPLNNNEIWSVQQQIQVACGQLLLRFQEIALEKGVERDLWNIGFRTTITLLQIEAKNKKKGDTEAKDVLNWFLNSASGFYLQLLNQISSANSLDLIFRRKDSVYGLVGGGLSSVPGVKTRDNVTKNALYLCQYCLIHLGDLARYRHQAKQAETFYRHAVTVAATSGHPYNQLALLEAGRGNKLASVFLYIRALCVPAPFPGAPSNLIQTLTKVLENRVNAVNESNTGEEAKVETFVRMTKDEYISLFLHFHSCLFLKGDVEASKDDIPRLTSALSMLAATTTLTRSSLVQMFAINVFALHYFSGKSVIKAGEETLTKREEEKFAEPKECEGAADLIEDLMIAMLAALLLPIHTMKEPEVVMTYPALPAIRLTFEWILHEDKILSQSLKKKQQIWPGLCSLVNFLQKPLANFNHAEGSETPLPEDRDLQGFQPLSKLMSKYRFKDVQEILTPDKCSLLRAKRLTDIAIKFSEKNTDGGSVIRKSVTENQLLKFEAHSNQNPSAEEIVDLERLTLQPQTQHATNLGKKKDKVGILKPIGSLERSKESKDNHGKEKKDNRGNKQIFKDPLKNIECRSKPEIKIKMSPGDKRIPISGSNTSILISGESSSNTSASESVTTINSKPRTRTNVALQAILKRNSSNPETKQVTFQTPSPAISPNPSVASNESQRSQLSSPPPPAPNKWGKPSSLLNANNLSTSKFSSFSTVDYQPLPAQSTPPFSNSTFKVQNATRTENPYNMFRTSHNSAPGVMLPQPPNNSEFGAISQQMLRQQPPHPTFQSPHQSSKQSIFQSNSKLNYPSDVLPFQNSDLQMSLYASKPNSNPWDKGSMAVPKSDVLMGSLQNNPTSPTERTMQLPYSELSPSFSHFQGPPPFQQSPFQAQQRNFPYTSLELDNRSQMANTTQSSTSTNVFSDPSFPNQPRVNPNIPSNMVSLFSQRNNMGPSASNQLGNLPSGSMTQSPNLSSGCSLGQGTPQNHHNSIGAGSSMSLGSIGHLPLGQVNNNISHNLGGNNSLNVRSNLGSGSNLIGSSCNIGQRSVVNSNDFLQSGPNFSWWDKEPPSTSLYLSQIINRPPPPYQSVASTTIDTSIPPPSSDRPYTSMIPSSISQGLSATPQTFGPDRQFSQEGSGSQSMRSSNTYSLFGPLGGSEPSGGQTAPSLHMLPSQAQQPNHQSLWSGMSPLQRLLEQKKYASNK